jgi:thiol-disulfide isomerase/thioredoxin
VGGQAIACRLRYDSTVRNLECLLIAVLLIACDDPGKRPRPPYERSSNAAASATATASASTGQSDHAGFVITEVAPAPNGKLTDALQTYYDTAKSAGLKLYVELGAEWCGPCVALKKSLSDPRMQQALKGTYIIRLDVHAWGDRLEKSGYSPNAIPVFYEVNAEGKPTGRKIDGGAWGDNIPANMAPPLDHFFHG